MKWFIFHFLSVLTGNDGSDCLKMSWWKNNEDLFLFLILYTRPIIVNNTRRQSPCGWVVLVEFASDWSWLQFRVWPAGCRPVTLSSLSSCSHTNPVCPADMEPLFKDKVCKKSHQNTHRVVMNWLIIDQLLTVFDFQIFRDVCCHREIMALKVYCRSEANGCQEQMSLQQIPVRKTTFLHCSDHTVQLFDWLLIIISLIIGDHKHWFMTVRVSLCLVSVGPPECVPVLRGSLSAG